MALLITHRTRTEIKIRGIFCKKGGFSRESGLSDSGFLISNICLLPKKWVRRKDIDKFLFILKIVKK